MNAEDWERLKEAYNFLSESIGVERIDNSRWTIYKVGNMIRIDIKVKL